MMVLYVRLWPCGICNTTVVYDSKKREMRCGCGKDSHRVGKAILETAFKRMAKIPAT